MKKQLKQQLSRQTSVLNEIQENQERMSVTSRYARIMAELSTLCNDRLNVITVDSLTHVATSGRAEPVKLTRETEKPTETMGSSSGSGSSGPGSKNASRSGTHAKESDLMSADAARRQRVEELTRFFMEAKSDIEFALGGGGREFREHHHGLGVSASSLLRDRERDRERGDNESSQDADKDDDKENDTADDEEDDKHAAAAADETDPVRKAAKLYERLCKEKVDPRVLNPMLSVLREQDPALYGAILCHPLITGNDPKKDKKKKKRRKERSDRKSEIKNVVGANASGGLSTGSSSGNGTTMLTPDFNAEPLSAPQVIRNIARFVAKAVADGSIQGLLLATRLVLSNVLNAESDAQIDGSKLQVLYPLAMHLRVLRGEKPPEMPKEKEQQQQQPSSDLDHFALPKSKPRDISATPRSDSTENENESRASGLDFDMDTVSLASLRARLNRFGDDIDAEEDDDRVEDTASLGEEGVDEDALMARAIALSLSPEITLREKSEGGDISNPPSMTDSAMGAPTSDDTAREQEPVIEKPRPPKFSPEEMLALGPFVLKTEAIEVDGMTVMLCLLGQMNRLCLDYLESCRAGIMPLNCQIIPHPLTFMLLNSVLTDLTKCAVDQAQVDHEALHSRWTLFRACGVLSLLRVMESHLFHVDVMNLAPALVGLGQVTKEAADGVGVANPLVINLKQVVLHYVNALAPCADVQDENDVIKPLILNSENYSSTDIDSAAKFYSEQIREQSIACWVRGIPHFYPSHRERIDVLFSLLRTCFDAMETAQGKSKSLWKWSFSQLDLLCARLALPDLAHPFVPTSLLDVELNAAYNNAMETSETTIESSKLDDVTLQAFGQRPGKCKPKWHPNVVRGSLATGSLTPGCLYSFLTQHAPPAVVESMGAATNATGDVSDVEPLAAAYELMWNLNRQMEQESLNWIGKLPELIDLLRKSVLAVDWEPFSFEDDYVLIHAPLVPILEKRSKREMRQLNSRVLLLRSIQDLMVQRISGCRGDDPPPLEFDPSRCAETMALSDGNRTAKQYTAKQWGMVMATTGCPPNTGIHEWAVRLDRCEKGHIFLGVCTRDASVATYVGGDRQGWGLIGTRALWHNRSKVRGDYGEGFSTGSLVRVRLNTDSGALSFGVDDNDWGIAFDGLTQHGTLYPAIGLYQRDDQVTIMAVPSQNSHAFTYSSVETSNKTLTIPAILMPVLHHFGTLMECCCDFLAEKAPATSQVPALARQIAEYPLLFPLLAPLIGSLGLVRDYHGLNALLAMHLVPWCTKVFRLLSNLLQSLQAVEMSDASVVGMNLKIDGEWELKSMAAGNIPAQQYQLTLSQANDGTVTGRSTGSFTSVTLKGVVQGTKLCFLETWRQGGTCLVEGRLRADGMVFHGSYEDTKSHTCGGIVGTKVVSRDQNDEAHTTATVNALILLEIISTHLLGSFSNSLISMGSSDLLVNTCGVVFPSTNEEIRPESSENLASTSATSPAEQQPIVKNSVECSSDEYVEWVNSELLSGGLPLAVVQDHLKRVLSQSHQVAGFSASPLPILKEAQSRWLKYVMPKSTAYQSTNKPMVSGSSSNFLQDLIAAQGDASKIDRWVSRHVGESPFARLGGESMKVARRTVCAAMIWHSGFLTCIEKNLACPPDNLAESEVRPHENLMHIWRASQRVIEWAVRAKNSMGSTYAIVAGLLIRKAQFLLEIEPSTRVSAAATAVWVLSSEMAANNGNTHASKASAYEYAERVYSEVLMQVSRFLESPIRVSVLQSLLLSNCTRSFLRVVGLMSLRFFLEDPNKLSERSLLGDTPSSSAHASAAIASALHWLAPAFLEGANGGKSTGDFGSAAKDQVSFTPSQQPEMYYYMGGLGGCGTYLRRDIRDAFEALYGTLCATLSRATWSRDIDLQLVTLQAWGIIIQPDDHAFLSRVGIFRVLQTVLDEARSMESHRDGLPDDNLPDHCNFAVIGSKRVVQAGLKVVHLLAAQVAHTDEDESGDKLLQASELASSSSASFGAVPLARKPSGPETLGKSVFHMLYTELKNAVDELRSLEPAVRLGAAVLAAEPTENEIIEKNDDTSGAVEYCYQICSLLFSVSGSAVCRSHLSVSKWLRLLLSLMYVNSLQIQRRSLKLLRRLLPSLNPFSIRVSPEDLESFEYDSDDDISQPNDAKRASKLVDFFLRIVGSSNPPSLVLNVLAKLADKGSSEELDDPFQPKGPCGTSAVVTEVVLLLRSLYGAPRWCDLLNQAIVNALSKIPSKCITEGLSIESQKSSIDSMERSSSHDSDVEMEDLSRPLPTLPQWKEQTQFYTNALSSLCVLNGHIEGLHLGATVKIMPRNGSSIQENAFRGARGIVVSFEPEKAAAEVLICGTSRSSDDAKATTSGSMGSYPSRPVRVPAEDLFLVPEVELDTKAFSDDVLNVLLVNNFCYFLGEIRKSLTEMPSTRRTQKSTGDEVDEDVMSNDESSSAGGENEVGMASNATEMESDVESSESPRRHSDDSEIDKPLDTKDILNEMEKESRISRMLLCQHGLRAGASLLKEPFCAGVFLRGMGPAWLFRLFEVAIAGDPCGSIGDLTLCEEKWLYLWSRWCGLRRAHQKRKSAQAIPASDESQDGSSQREEDAGAVNPLVQQMMEMGFSKEWCEVALARCSQNVEAAINFCFEHSSDMERLLQQYKAAKEASKATNTRSTRKEADVMNPLLEQLSEMGFPVNWCKKALVANRNNVDAALTWILSNGEALEAEDRREEMAKLRSGDSKEAGDVAVKVKVGPNPLRAVSGQASINEDDMLVEGLVGGGFASVGAPDCMVSSGRWYYEATLFTNGCIQIGWADAAFNGAAERGDGVGDGPNSWAYDGWRQQKWHGLSSPWGAKWKQGDVVGCAVDADAGTIIFSLNGKMRSVNMGIAFRSVKFSGGLYPCASFNRRERLQYNLGGLPFKYPPPPGFKPILHALCRDENVEQLPSGFSVVGSREDCLEEAVGEENYSNESRYFVRDLHPSLMRNATSGHSRGGVGLGNTRMDATAEMRGIPDNQVYEELLIATRNVAILQARRALFTLLAKWPVEEVGPFTMKVLMENADHSREASSKLIEFIRIVAGLNQLSGGSSSSTPVALLTDTELSYMLDCGATGRYSLSILASIFQSALCDSLGQTGRGEEIQHSLIGGILSCIGADVELASHRRFARVIWDAPDAVIANSLAQIAIESSACAPKSTSSQTIPNLFLAEWMSTLLMKCMGKCGEQLSSGRYHEIRQKLFHSWLVSLKSPSLCVKERGFSVLSGLLQDMVPKKPLDAEEVPASLLCQDPERQAVIKDALKSLPLRRLFELADDRMLKEYPTVPVCSKYLQSLVELVSTVSLAHEALGVCWDASNLDDGNARLLACKQLESELAAIDLQEFEEVQAANRKKQEAIAALEKAKRESGDGKDDAKDNNNEAANAEMKERGMSDVEENMATSVTSMDIDTSDIEEGPDLTLSAIANMVAEDSDVVAAAAAIAAATNNRLTIKREIKMIETEARKKEEFEFVFPEEEIVYDVSMLNEHECRLLEEAQHGILGSYPSKWRYGHEAGILGDCDSQLWSGTLHQNPLRPEAEINEVPPLQVGCKVVRGPNWKWRDQDGGEGSVGVVEGISPWSGVDGEGMSVRWPNDSLYTYRWGADGNYDLTHVEVDQEGKIVKEYLAPKVKPEEEGTFGAKLHLGVLLHIFEEDHTGEDYTKISGIMEWPDYSSAVLIVGRRFADRSLCVQELQMVRGNPDLGWSLRFGTEKWIPGTRYTFKPVNPDEAGVNVELLRGEYTHPAMKKGKLLQISGEIRLSTRHLFTMDPHNHFSTLAISEDGLSVTCTSGESRNLALATVGFASGIHYWEVFIDQAEFGSVFIGVCEKTGPPGSQAALSSRLNRWHGWGFVNFRATYHNSTERIYGDHFNAGDTIGVRLDMEQGKLSFFMDGVKYGEHIVTDLGVAFENIKGERNTRTLFPCIGMRKSGDRVSLNEKWVSMPGVLPQQILSDCMEISKSFHALHNSNQTARNELVPNSLLRESWKEWRKWSECRWQRFPARPRGVVIDFDTWPSTCIAVCKRFGLDVPFLAGDRVRISSKCGRELDQPEEAVVLGVYRGFLWYRTESQGNEGAEEGRSWAWYWSFAELRELILIRRDGKDMTLIENDATDVSTSLLAEQKLATRSEIEARARSDFNAFCELATKTHSVSSDVQLVDRLNTFCAAMGVEIINLKFSDVLTGNEIDEINNNEQNSSHSTRTRARSLVLENDFSTNSLKNLSGAELRARCAVLRTLNSKLLRVLPFICLQSTSETGRIIEVAGKKDISALSSLDWLYLSTSLKLRCLRRLVFTSIKRSFWDMVLRSTTTSTPLPSDEYEDPREIRVIRINRIQAQATKLSVLSQPGDRLRRSVFGQLYREMRTWSDSSFRRAYCGKGHGGQRRAFKVKFLGEGVNDYGGPYRAVFEQIVDELQMDNIELAKGEQGLLPLLIPCPNRRSGTGGNQDKFLLNPSCGASLVSNGPIALELHRFLGKIIGTAVRHGLQMGLDLPTLVWRPLAGLEVGRGHLEGIDVVAANNLVRVEECNSVDMAEELLSHLVFSAPLSDGTEVSLCPNGDKISVTLENRLKYVELVEFTRLTESSQQLAALREGLASVLPMELSPLFTPRELEVLICGRREVDVELLRQCTEYDDEVNESMPHIQFFWQVLKEMTSEERTSFLRFVWARSRMPNSAKDFPMNFKIQAARDQGAREEPDKYLPHAQTCFFSLSLPAYTSKEILRNKLVYAIQNSPNMDADIRLHNAEGWADA